MKAQGLKVDFLAFLEVFSFVIFKERKCCLGCQHSPVAGRGERSGRLCFLVDEMQEATCREGTDIQKGVEDVFRFIWNSCIPLLGLVLLN